MIDARILLLITAICLGFAAWNVHLHQTTSYNATTEWNSSERGIHVETCPSLWERLTDEIPPPSGFQEPQSQINLYGPTVEMIKRSACDASIVGREHVSEIWLAGATVSLASFLALWRKTEDIDRSSNIPT